MDTKRVLNALISSQRIMVNELAILSGQNREGYGKINHYLDLAEKTLNSDPEQAEINNTVIKLSNHEIQSGIDRIQIAEHLIQKLPEDHEGRNTWLLNYGKGAEGDYLRRNHNHGPIWDVETESLIKRSEGGEWGMSLLKQVDVSQEMFRKFIGAPTQISLTLEAAVIIGLELKKNSGGKDFKIEANGELFDLKIVLDEETTGIGFVIY